MNQGLPLALADWTVERVQQLVSEGYHETDWFEFKEVLNGRTPDFKWQILKAACSFANTRGGFLVFGVAAGGSGVDRVVGLPSSLELQKELADKLQPAEPSVEFSVLNPCPDVGNGRVLLIVQVAGTRGPHWFRRGSEAPGEFWKRSEGTAQLMTHREIEEAFVNHAERVAKVKLVFISLIDNWIRLMQINRNRTSTDSISTVVPDTSQIRQHLAEVNALAPNALGEILVILRECDNITNMLQMLMPAFYSPLSNRSAILTEHNRQMGRIIDEAQPYFADTLAKLQRQFGFPSVITDKGPIPPVSL